MASRGVNKVILLGTFGQDPEVRYLPNGSAVCNFSIATNESWKDKNTGEAVEKTEWHKCVCFARGAEIIGEYMKKGSKIYLEGQLQTRKWKKDGQDHYTTEIKVNDFQFLGDSGGQSGGQRSSGESRPKSAPGPAPSDDFEDDIPFN